MTSTGYALQPGTAALLEAIQGATTGFLVLCDPATHRFEHVGSSVASLLGYSPEEVRTGGLDFFLSRIHPEDVDSVLSRIREGLLRWDTNGGEGVLQADHRLAHRDGTWRWFRATATLTAPLDAPTARLVILATDIDDQRTSEEAFARQEKAFTALVQGASDLLTILDRNGIILLESPSIERFAGLPPGSRLGTSAFDAIHPMDRGRVMTQFREAAEHPSLTFTVEYRYRHTDGSWHWARSQSVNQLHNPVIRGFVVNSRDVTEERKAQDYRERMELILDHASQMSGIGHFEVDLATRTSLWSKSHFHLWRREQGRGAPRFEEILALLHPEDQARFRDAVNHCLQTGDPFEEEFRVCLEDGSRRTFASKGGVLRDEDGTVTRLVGATQDITDRKAAEEALRQRESQYRTLVESSPDVIMRFDRDLRHLFTSPKVEAQTGIPAPAFLGRTHRELGFPEELCAQWEAVLEEVFREGCPRSLRFNLPTGPILEWRLFPEFGADGTVQTVLTLAQDVTELARRQKALQASEQRFRELTELLPQPVFELDREGRFCFGNQAAFRNTRYTPEDLAAGLGVLQLLPKEAQHRGQRLLRHALLRPQHGQELTIVRKDGSRFPALAYTAPIAPNGRSEGVRGILVDISERKRAEEAVAVSEAMYRALFENTGCASIVDDEDTTILLVNTEWERLTQVPRAVQEGKMSWMAFTPPEEKARLQAIHDLRRQDESRAPDAFELRFLDSQGETHQMICHVAMIPGSRKTIATMMDITELRKAEAERHDLQERLRQAEKLEAIGQLAGGIAHDFNNQLGAIQGFADLLRDRIEDPDLHRYAERISTSCQRTANTTRQLLAFARKGNYLSAPVDIHELISEVVQLLKHSFDKRIEFRLELNAERSTVLGDSTQLLNALMNLSVNARDAMPEGGILGFSTRTRPIPDPDAWDIAPGTSPEACLEIRVHDTGCGMPEEILQHLFEPFFTTKEVGKGTGLGLASIYGTVQNHRGSIRVDSHAGEGTTFEILLPLAETAAVAEEQEPDAPSGQVHARILVVEDEELVGEMLLDMLRTVGFEPVWKRDSLDAIQEYQQNGHAYDLVILDMMMPHVGGREAFRRMKEVNPSIRALIASGYSQEGEAQAILDEGACGFLQKPFRLQELQSTVNRVLGQGPA